MAQELITKEFEKVAARFRQLLPAQGKAGGAALCIYHQGRPVLDIWGGTRNRQGHPWQAYTLSLSFSTTKGVVATLLHILASRGLLDYDKPVAHYWPAFAQSGKSLITVRHILCHEAGLYPIRPLIQDASEMRDWSHMLQVIERAEPVHAAGAGNGYHAFTFGWLVGGLIEKITGEPLADTLQRELVQPLQLDGCFIGIPTEYQSRCADLLLPERAPAANKHPSVRRRYSSLAQQMIDQWWAWTGFDPASVQDAMRPLGMSRFDWNTEASRAACIPGAGGQFTARALAKIYAALANDGEIDGVRILPSGTVARFATVQNRQRGAVIPIPMRWRLGYHRVFTTGPRTPNAFGHFGYGGSGAWCDPSRELAVGYTVNYGIGTPFGDMRLWQLNTQIIRAVENLPELMWQWLRA